MGILRKAGKGVGRTGGFLIGGTTKLAGKAVGTKWESAGNWLEDVGDSVETASTVALDNLGQFLDGTAETTYGYIKKTKTINRVELKI
ncbi:hypothetical protein [Oceanobacillus damuensis]|uniref:hypothetical protein n=1 Tax=Oceanobacillus damuensis TaxID=937928 RepID=UPI000831D7CE|nr:hypothetical protein [Oceanobacillus damuensis]